MAWDYSGYGYSIQIDDTFKEACYRTTHFTETGCIYPNQSGQRPIPIMSGWEFWCTTPFWYRSNLSFYAVVYMWVKNQDQGGYGGMVHCPASSSWVSRAVSTRKYVYDDKNLGDGRKLGTRRVIYLGFSSEWGVDWSTLWQVVADDGDADVYLNRQYVNQYQNLGTSFSVKVKE